MPGYPCAGQNIMGRACLPKIVCEQLSRPGEREHLHNCGAVRAVSEPVSLSTQKELAMISVSSRSTTSLMLPALLLGAVAGLRSQLPGALLALAVRQGMLPQGRRIPLRWLSARWGLPGAALAAGGELIGDKLPVTPSRLAPAPLIGRLVSGGAAGIAIADATSQSAI